MSKKPESVKVRSYQVGFGDCFLLTFNYPNNVKKHILIDFGSTGTPNEENGFKNEKNKDLMLTIAEDIKKTCDGKLDAVVATHRHKDHISGFATQGEKNSEGKTRGDIIRECSPDLVILPWTEEPNLAPDANEPFQFVTKNSFKKDENAKKHFVSNLQSMHEVARAIYYETQLLFDSKFIQPIGLEEKEQLQFMGDNNITNRSAVENLMTMAKNGKGCYVHAEFDLQKDFNKHFPGIKVYVLGPPTVKQYPKVKKQRSKDKDEFWLQQMLNKNFWAVQAETAKTIKQDDSSGEEVRESPFPRAARYEGEIPPQNRWFIRRLRSLRGNQLLYLVRILDNAMNNTSVILLFEIGDQKLLFPGDAQIENWEYALSKDKYKKLLADTTLYKVGHHGSCNATPKTLWKSFIKKSDKVSVKKSEDTNIRLKTIVSTMHGKHGHTKETAVPKETLVEELKTNSDYQTTEDINDIDRLFIETNIEIGN